MVTSHPWFTLIVGAICVWFIYLFVNIFKDIEERLSNLRSALDGLLRISSCRCNKAGTCAHCNASRLLEKESRIPLQEDQSETALRTRKGKMERFEAGIHHIAVTALLIAS
jgi:hypothetical protein